MTENPLKVADVPTVVATVMPRELATASPAIVMITGRLVSVPLFPIVTSTPVPLIVTAVAPAKPDPVIVPETMLP